MEAPKQRDTFPAEFLLELAQVDELFRYQITTARTPEQALHDIAPTLRLMGDVTGEDERKESGAERRLMFRTVRGHDFYLYEDDRKLWLDVSRLDEGEQGSAIYAALFDYAANTDRQFMAIRPGYPTSPCVAARRPCSRRRSSMDRPITWSRTRARSPEMRRLACRHCRGTMATRWETSKALVDVSLASLTSKMPEFQRARYDFASRTFRTGEGKPLTDGALARWADGQGRDREAGAGRATYKRGILLNTLACAESGERPGLLERVLSQPRQLVGTSAEGIFY
jgi:hypothetical protein